MRGRTPHCYRRSVPSCSCGTPQIHRPSSVSARQSATTIVSGFACPATVRSFWVRTSMAVPWSVGRIPAFARALGPYSVGAGASTIRSTRRLDSTQNRTFTTLRDPPLLASPFHHLTASPNRNQCSIFRPWQGWSSMSTTGPGEGTLRVAPMLKMATAYLMLRPFFKPRTSSSGLDDWVVDVESATFPGSQMGKTQELNETTHPHLQLGRTMVSMPRVEPGDQIYCECPPLSRNHSRVVNQWRLRALRPHTCGGSPARRAKRFFRIVHSSGTFDRSKVSRSLPSYVHYTPIDLYTPPSAEYLRDQREHFSHGLPAP